MWGFGAPPVEWKIHDNLLTLQSALYTCRFNQLQLGMQKYDFSLQAVG